jgi:2OG-Fe(II) oxygenase superfamily
VTLTRPSPHAAVGEDAFPHTKMNNSEQLPVDVIYDRDFIAIYRCLTEDLCRAVIDLFEQDNRKWRGKIVSLGTDVAYDGDIKSSWDLEILNVGPRRNVFQSIHPNIEACMSHYLSRSPILRSFKVEATGYKIQMYPKNQGYFRWHADSVGKNAGSRVVAMILYLNDVAKGGETDFFHQGIKITPIAGHLLLFPAGWNYMHCGHIPESGDKYIIQSFVRIKE